jgi:hypothetical protein
MLFEFGQRNFGFAGAIHPSQAPGAYGFPNRPAGGKL